MYSALAIASQVKLNCGADGLDTFVRPTLLLLFLRNLANPAPCYARRSAHFLFHFTGFNDDFCCYHHHHKLVPIYLFQEQTKSRKLTAFGTGAREMTLSIASYYYKLLVQAIYL